MPRTKKIRPNIADLASNSERPLWAAISNTQKKQLKRAETTCNPVKSLIKSESLLLPRVEVRTDAVARDVVVDCGAS